MIPATRTCSPKLGFPPLHEHKAFVIFRELRRRNVLKVALVYAVVSWLLIDVAWIGLPMLDAPEWILIAFIVLVALGFVVTVFVSWNFEMTPED
jgi:adenylate cyclase